MKLCKKCNITKPLMSFARMKGMRDGYKNICEDCRNLRRRELYALDPTRQFNNSLKFRYGLNLEEYAQKFVAQDGACAICKTHQSKLKHFLCVDHSHQTGEVRGLLCHTCNRGIGLLKDSPSILTTAVNYLSRKVG